MSTSDHPPDSERSRTRNRRLEEIFEAALDLAPDERAVFLDRACAGDDELRREVEGLLEVERAPTLGPLPSGALAVDLGVSDLHPSLKGLSVAPGMQMGRYELLRTLGQGGMGTVFLAQDTRLHRRVAIKFVHAATQEMTERFLAEARTTARCKHENIVVIHDVDEIDGHPYMVLEHLEGEPLRQRLAGLIGASDTASATPAARRRDVRAVAPAMPVATVLELVIPVVRALVCAHSQGIVHRDLKPENVFLCSNGTVKVLDFGIAKALTEIGAVSQAVYASTQVLQEHVLTEQGALLGTLPYMSPEQWGADEIDERTDLWAVGIMLYEMLAGQHPLAPLSYSKLQKQVPDLDLSMPSIGTAVPGLDKLTDIVDGCLRKPKADRISSAETLLHSLEEMSAGSSVIVREVARENAPAAPPPLAEEHNTQAEAGREPAQEASPHAVKRSRSRRLIPICMGMGLSVLILSALWPRLSLSQFPGGSGGIVLTVHAGADEELLQTHRALCTALRTLDTQAVRCVELPRFGIYDGVLLEAATGAGASLIAQFEGDHELRLLPAGTAAGILSELPTIHAAATETQQHLPSVLHPLSRVLAGDSRFDELSTPSISTDTVGWRLGTLVWYLNILARNRHAIPPADVRSTMTRCREAVSIADVTCALAYYVYTQLDPTPSDARHWLEELLTHGPPAFKELVEVELAEDDCMHEPERAQATLLRLAARWADDPCRRVTLVGAATCLLTRRPDSHANLRRIAYPEEDNDFTGLVNDKERERRAKERERRGKNRYVMGCRADSTPLLLPPLCGAYLFAVASAERGQWNMLAQNWEKAARDFSQAWRRGNHPMDLLHWAESLLHLRNSSADVEKQIAEALDLRYFEGNDELRHLAAFLRWLATHDEADAGNVLDLYSEGSEHTLMIVDRERRLAEVACAKPKNIECRVYGILTQPKQPGAEEELRRLLLAAALAERGQRSMLAQNWAQAAGDLATAWHQGGEPLDLLHWAESLLYQRDSRAGVTAQIAETLDLRYFKEDDELRHLAAFLRWLATHDEADAANVLRFYNDEPRLTTVIVDEEYTLARLVCAEAEYAECQAYRILTQPKQLGSEEELRRILNTDDKRQD